MTLFVETEDPIKAPRGILAGLERLPLRALNRLVKWQAAYERKKAFQSLSVDGLEDIGLDDSAARERLARKPFWGVLIMAGSPFSALSTNRVAELATLMGEPARTAMLMVLADGRALTAGELAGVAGVTPQTASGHLAKLTEAGLLEVRPSGRHRYFRIPSKDVADTLEGLFRIATAPGSAPVTPPRTGPRDAQMARARSCYDHIGGRLGVAMADAMVDRGWIEFQDTAGIVTEAGTQALGIAGIFTPAPGKAHAQCRPCLDWSERREHVAGPLGKSLMLFLLDKGYVTRIGDTRGLTVTRPGETALWDLFGIRWHELA